MGLSIISDCQSGGQDRIHGRSYPSSRGQEDTAPLSEPLSSFINSCHTSFAHDSIQALSCRPQPAIPLINMLSTGNPGAHSQSGSWSPQTSAEAWAPPTSNETRVTRRRPGTGSGRHFRLMFAPQYPMAHYPKDMMLRHSDCPRPVTVRFSRSQIPPFPWPHCYTST